MEQFGTTLKEWRGYRRMSQLDLALSAEVSARHISFLETGRSKPTRSMIRRLADCLQIPHVHHNHLLNLAGFSAQFKSCSLEDESMVPIKQAIAWTMEQHSPYPAIILDRHWKVIEANQPAKLMFSAIGLSEMPNLLEETLAFDGIKTKIKNWPEVRNFLLTRLRLENNHIGGDEFLENAIAQLNTEHLAQNYERNVPLPPILPMTISLHGQDISLFSTIAQFGSAEDIALAEYRLELFFPHDEVTKQLFLNLK